MIEIITLIPIGIWWGIARVAIKEAEIEEKGALHRLQRDKDCPRENFKDVFEEIDVKRSSAKRMFWFGAIPALLTWAWLVME